MLFYVLTLVFLALGLAKSEKNKPIQVEIENGTISGRTIKSLQNRTIYAFLEIPYAQPPVGNLRFKDPLPAKNWTGILDTTKNTKICWETRFNQSIDDPRQNEDCLYLNVFSPVPPGASSSLPVWVYIYGGRFLFGHGDYDTIDPQLFVDSDIVAVTLNFRSGPLGFLTTEDGVIPANLGLKDQNLALRWIQDNIKYFGGDPSKVVLAGQSSGGACVSHQVITSKTTGLFRGAIIQSGSAISAFSISKNARFLAYEMGKLYSSNFNENNSTHELLEILLQLPARTITYTEFPHLYIDDSVMEQEFYELFWKPVIERSDIPNAYLTKLPHESLLTGDFQRVPLLTGITSEESLYFENALPKFQTHLDKSTILFENNNIKWGFRKYVEKRMKQIYTKHSFLEDKVALVRYLSDYLFAMNCIRVADLHSKFADTFFYQFSYYGKMNELVRPGRNVNIKGLGNTGHGEELPYLIFYPGKARNVHQYPESDRFIQRRIVKLWTNFVKYLNPTPTEEHLAEFKKWPKLSKNHFTFFDINTNISIIEGFPRPYEEWKPIIDDYLQHPLGNIIC